VTQTTLFCTFCRKSEHEIAKLVAGPGVYICNECIDAANRIIAEDASRPITDLSRISEDDLLRTLAQTNGDLAPSALDLTVKELRRRGVTWARIGGALGISRQAAWERFSGEE
jgi:hypothetical protein